LTPSAFWIVIGDPFTPRAVRDTQNATLQTHNLKPMCKQFFEPLPTKLVLICTDKCIMLSRALQPPTVGGVTAPVINRFQTDYLGCRK